MNQSKTGLNDSFYNWIDNIRKATRVRNELQEMLDYYNVKLIGYKSLNFDFLGISTSFRSDEILLYWMDKIDMATRKMKVVEHTLKDFQDFYNELEDIEKRILLEIIMYSKLKDIAVKIGMTTDSVGQIRTRISNKWYRSRE